jgi:hypothetical protein
MPVPRFWQRIEERYKSGLSHQFLVYFNIDDLVWDDVYGYLHTKDFLMEQMNRLGCDAVLSYSRSEGIRFPNLGVRDAYQNALKLARINDEIEPIPEDMPKFDRLNARFRKVGQEKLIRETEVALVTLENFFRQGMGNVKVGLIVSDVEKIAPNRSILPLSDQIMDELVIDTETLQRWALDAQFKLRGHIILLLTENMANVAPELSISNEQTTYPVKIPMPGYAERLAYIRHLLNILEAEGEENKYKLELPEGMMSENFARLTHGLNLRDIQSIWLTSKQRATPVAPSMIIQQNRISVAARSYGMLNIIYGDHGINMVGGLKTIIPYMQSVIEALKAGDNKSTPMGILMLGPPGTGKTTLINALSRDAGLHFVLLRDVRSISVTARSDWDLSRALGVIQSLAPVVVFMDNLDKIKYTCADAREQNIIDQNFDNLVRFMSDPSLRGKVLWIGAGNNPYMICPELRRNGIFEDVIPFLMPNPGDREDILKKLFSKNAIPYDNRINFGALTNRAYMCSGADLEVIATRSYQNSRLAQRDTVTEQDISKAMDEFIPIFEPAMYEYMMLTALSENNRASLVPKQLEGSMQNVVYQEDKINKNMINQRIRELEMNLQIQRERHQV